MTKRFLAAALCLIMALTLLPATALAANEVTIAGLGMTATATESNYYVNGANGSQGTVSPTEPASWNAKLAYTNGAYKLTLNGLNVHSTLSGIKSDVPLTIHLEGGIRNQVVLDPGSTPGAAALSVNGDLTLTAASDSARLEVFGHVGDGIHVTGNLTIEGSVKFAHGITRTAGFCGIYVGGDLLAETDSGEVSGKCDITTNTSSRGVKVGGNVVANSEDLYAYAGNSGVGLEAGGSIRLNSRYSRLDGGTQAVNKQPDLSAYPSSYIYSIDNMQSWQPMPYSYDAAHQYVAIIPMPSIAISSVTASGKTGAGIAPVDATITPLAGEWLINVAAGDVVSGWFTNIPAGLTATIKETTVDSWGNVIAVVVAFSGVPTEPRTEAMAVTIPADKMVYGLPIPVPVNADAKWAIAPTVAVTSAVGTRFLAGGATDDAKFTVTSTGAPFTAPLYFDGAMLAGQTIDLGVPDGAAGADGSVTTGSIIVTVNRAKLNTLAAGDHTLEIKLKDGPPYNGQTLRGVISVQGAGDADGAAAVPKTGDGARPLLWLGLVLLAGAGLAISVAVRRRKQAE